jgi:hypothetical protein
MAKGITSNTTLLNRSNYALRGKRLKRHEKNNTLLENERTGTPGARRRFSNTKGTWTPPKAGETVHV